MFYWWQIWFESMLTQLYHIARIKNAQIYLADPKNIRPLPANEDFLGCFRAACAFFPHCPILQVVPSTVYRPISSVANVRPTCGLFGCVPPRFLSQHDENIQYFCVILRALTPTWCTSCCPTTGHCASVSKHCWPRTGGVVGKMVWLVGCWREDGMYYDSGELVGYACAPNFVVKCMFAREHPGFHDIDPLTPLQIATTSNCSRLRTSTPLLGYKPGGSS